MTVSGTKTFELDVADYIIEAFERCGLDSRTGYDFRTAQRSLNILLAEWANRGLNQWTIDRATIPLVAGTTTYALGESTIDILSAAIRMDQNIGNQNQTDLTIDRISRDQYLNIPNKLTRARPVQFVVERYIAPQVTVWPAPDQVYYLIIDKLVRMDDAGSGVNTLQIPFRFYPCLAAGLAYYISLKKAPERAQMLKLVYDEEFERAAQEDRDRAPLQLTPVRDFYRVV